MSINSYKEKKIHKNMEKISEFRKLMEKEKLNRQLSKIEIILQNFNENKNGPITPGDLLEEFQSYNRIAQNIKNECGIEFEDLQKKYNLLYGSAPEEMAEEYFN